jgi:hypothetical protein
MIGFKKYWFGKEVEGRFTDVETLFIADIYAAYEDGVFEDMPAHIYVCSLATEQLISDEHSEMNWNKLFNLIDQKTFISIEATPEMIYDIPPMLRIHCHIMLMISSPEAGMLKKTDSIKLVYDDYSLYCTTVYNMQRVAPDDYKFDQIYE